MTLPQNIDDYLDRLLDALRLDGKASRRALVETEDHLLSSKEEKVANGMDGVDAEQAAIANFGYPETVANRFNRTLRPGLHIYAARGFLAIILTVGIIFTAIGFSGILALAGGEIYGKDYIATAIPKSELSEERCVHILQAGTSDIEECQAAKLSRDYWTVIGGRFESFAIGVALLVMFFLARRFWRGSTEKPVRPSVKLEALGLFAFAGVLYYVGLVDHPSHRFPGGQATGEMMTLSVVLAACFVAYAAMLTRKVVARHRLINMR